MSIEFKVNYRSLEENSANRCIYFVDTTHRMEVRFLPHNYTFPDRIVIFKKLNNDLRKTFGLNFLIDPKENIFDLETLKNTSLLGALVFCFTGTDFMPEPKTVELRVKYQNTNTTLASFLNGSSSITDCSFQSSTRKLSDAGISGTGTDRKNVYIRSEDEVLTSINQFIQDLTRTSAFTQAIFTDPLVAIFSNPEYMHDIKKVYNLE